MSFNFIIIQALQLYTIPTIPNTNTCAPPEWQQHHQKNVLRQGSANTGTACTNATRVQNASCRPPKNTGLAPVRRIQPINAAARR